jgi:hypothetical protein
MMRSEEEWKTILVDIADDNKAAVRAALKAATQRYEGDAGRNEPRPDQMDAWARVKNWALSKDVSKIQKLVAAIDASNPAATGMSRLADAIAGLPALARAQIELLRPISKDEGLIIDTFQAWTGPGNGRLVVSQAGPQQRFFCAFTAPFLGDLSGRQHANLAKAEKRRRAILEPITGRGEGSATADATTLEALPKWPFLPL